MILGLTNFCVPSYNQVIMNNAERLDAILEILPNPFKQGIGPSKSFKKLLVDPEYGLNKFLDPIIKTRKAAGTWKGEYTDYFDLLHVFLVTLSFKIMVEKEQQDRREDYAKRQARLQA